MSGQESLHPRNALFHLLTHRPDGVTVEADGQASTIEVYDKAKSHEFRFVSKKSRLDHSDIFSLEAQNASNGWTPILEVLCDDNGAYTIRVTTVTDEPRFSSEIVRYDASRPRGEAIGWSWPSYYSGISLKENRLSMILAGHLHRRDLPAKLDVEATVQAFFKQISHGDFSTPTLVPAQDVPRTNTPTSFLGSF